MSGVGFAGWTVFCADLATASRFYENVLGFTRESTDDHHINLLAPIANHAGATAGLLLHASDHPDPVSLGSFAADDVDKLVGKVRAAGCAIVQEPNNAPWGVRDAAFSDPDGNGIYVSGPLKPTG